MEISFAAKIFIQAIANVLRGQEFENFLEVLRVLDVILRQNVYRFLVIVFYFFGFWFFALLLLLFRFLQKSCFCLKKKMKKIKNLIFVRLYIFKKKKKEF